ncbi:MAG: TatD family hydrolase [Candidatus Competibacterales bacterium]
MLIDSHCHLDRLDLSPFDGQLAAAIGAAAAVGVEGFLCVAVDLETWPAMAAAVAPFDQVALSVGVHPCTQAHRPAVDGDALAALARDPRVVAVGETGLDYYHARDEAERRRQRAGFARQIGVAKALGLPLIIHSRDAAEDTLGILEAEGAEATGGVMHCFSYDLPTMARAVELNFTISFSGIITYKNAHALREVARQVPGDRLLVETDSPYLAPLPHRGRSNQPAWVVEVAEVLAEVRGESLDQVAAVTTANYRRLFGPPGDKRRGSAHPSLAPTAVQGAPGAHRSP